MDSEKRERVIQLGAQIIGLRTEIAALQSKLTESEADLDRLFADTTPSPTPSSLPTTDIGPATESPSPKRTLINVPPVIGSLSDQALAILKANSEQMFSGEALTAHLNRMPGRITPANVDSVNAALSRLTTDGLISRVERGLYKAKPTMNTT